MTTVRERAPSCAARPAPKSSLSAPRIESSRGKHLGMAHEAGVEQEEPQGQSCRHKSRSQLHPRTFSIFIALTAPSPESTMRAAALLMAFLALGTAVVRSERVGVFSQFPFAYKGDDGTLTGECDPRGGHMATKRALLPHPLHHARGVSALPFTRSAGQEVIVERGGLPSTSKEARFPLDGRCDHSDERPPVH